MGMDSVELIMAVEEAFDIHLPDEEIAKLNTVGTMYAAIVSRLALNQPGRCPSSAVFYQTRRALMELHGFPRRSIAPATPMDSLLPASGRREHWRELSERIGAPLPALSLPGWTGATFRDLGVALLWICLAACFVFPQSTALVCIVGSALLAWAARRTAAPFEVAIPAECATVGDTVRAILRSTQGMTSQTPKVWEPNEVWETLRRIVAEQFDVPLDVVTVTTDFVRDLGAD